MTTRLEWLIEVLRLINTYPVSPTSLELCLIGEDNWYWKYCLVHEDQDLEYPYINGNRISKEDFYNQYETARTLAIIAYYEEPQQIIHQNLNVNNLGNFSTRQYCFQKAF